MLKSDSGVPDTVKSSLEGDVRRVGSYIVLSEIGKGSSGRVFLSRKPDSQKKFALKAIERSQIRNAHQKRLMHDEVKIMQLIDHPNVIHLYDYMASETHYYMVLDYCDGGDLYNYIQRREGGFVEEPEAVEIFKQLANGFFELRKHRIIHRDVKAENVFRREGQWLLGDFGMAKLGEDTAKSLVGSPEFMAPEMLRSGPKNKVNYSSKVDLWSIGCLFFEILFGRPPFHYKSTEQMLRDVEADGGERLRLPRVVSASAGDLLRRLLQPDPQRRLDWPAFFSHPLFQLPGPVDLAQAPQIGRIQTLLATRNSVDDQFKLNRGLSPPVSETPLDPSALPPPVLHEVCEVPYEESAALRLEALCEELLQRYLHERNKIWWTVFVANKLAACGRDPTLRPARDRLAFASYASALKALGLSARLLHHLKTETNVFGFPPDLFAALLKSAQFATFCAATSADQTKISALVEELRGGVQGAKLDESVSVDATLKKLFLELVEQLTSLAKNDRELHRFFRYVLVLVKSAFATEDFFPYASENGEGLRFDWAKFYRRVECGSVKEVQELLEIG